MFWFLMFLAGVTIYFGAMALEGKVRGAFFVFFFVFYMAVVGTWVNYQNTKTMLDRDCVTDSECVQMYGGTGYGQ